MNLMVEWDTFQLFETLLDNFDTALLKAKYAAAGRDISLPVAIAVEGFRVFQSDTKWTQQHRSYIQRKVEDEFSPEALEWFEECADAVSTFSCYALGALLGKLAVEEIDASEHALGEVHLPGFVLLKNEPICSQYESSQIRSNEF